MSIIGIISHRFEKRMNKFNHQTHPHCSQGLLILLVLKSFLTHYVRIVYHGKVKLQRLQFFLFTKIVRYIEFAVWQKKLIMNLHIKCQLACTKRLCLRVSEIILFCFRFFLPFYEGLAH